MTRRLLICRPRTRFELRLLCLSLVPACKNCPTPRGMASKPQRQSWASFHRYQRLASVLDDAEELLVLEDHYLREMNPHSDC